MRASFRPGIRSSRTPVGLLQETKQELQEREKHRRAYHLHQDRVEELRDRLHGEKALRDRLLENRKELRGELREEAEKDATDAGLHGEEWEARVGDRADDLAEQIEVCEFHIDAVLERIDKQIDLRHQFAKEIEQDEDRLERLRERRRRREENRAGQLTPNFHIEEFRCTDGTAVPDAAVPALTDVCRRYLEPARARFGPLGVTSGYRTRTYNTSIDGASNSVHIYDAHAAACAVDHVSGSHAASELQHFHDATTHPDGMGYYAGFTHVDNRGKIGWAVPTRWTGAG